MTIRSRLTLWYGVTLFVSSLVIAGLVYDELHEQSAAQNDPGEALEHSAVEILAWCGIPAALLALGGGWWFTRKSLAPVTALTLAAERIHEHNLREQLPRSGNGDELDRLTEVFNSMTARLDQSFQRIREFTLHASHELKTPLTIMHGGLETALTHEKTTGEQREFLLSQLDEVQRLTRIVDGLSLLTKADSGLIALNREPIRLDELLREAYSDALILAQPQKLEAIQTEPAAVTVLGDRDRLRQMLLNLTDNAIKYNQPNGQVTMELRVVEGQAELVVANTGPGLAQEFQSRVFDRFFRGEHAHQNDLEGCGLGLSIAQWIVKAHGGTIEFASEPQGWTRVKGCQTTD